MKGYLNVGWYKRKVNGIPGLHLDLNKIAMKCIVAQGHGLSSALRWAGPRLECLNIHEMSHITFLHLCPSHRFKQGDTRI